MSRIITSPRVTSVAHYTDADGEFKLSAIQHMHHHLPNRMPPQGLTCIMPSYPFTSSIYFCPPVPFPLLFFSSFFPAALPDFSACCP